jgi:hypothetical protein
MIFSFIEILILMIILGGGAVVLGLILFAVAKGRPGLAALVGALAILPVLAIVAVGALIFTVRSDHTPAIAIMSEPGVASMSHAQSGAEMSFNTFPQTQFTPSEVHTTWKIAFAPVLFMVFGGVALLILAGKRGFGQAAACGRGRIWPAFVALPLFALLFFGSVRYQKTSSSGNQAVQQSHVVHQQQVAMAQEVAAMAKGLQKQIESMDIHELMDKFDAPRIVLQSRTSPAAAPVILAIAAVQTDAAPLAEAAANVEEEDSSQKQSRSAESSSVSSASKEEKDDALATAELVNPPTPPAPPAPPEIAQSTAAPPAIVKNAATPKAIARNEAAPRPDWIDEIPKRTGYTRRDLIVTDEYESIDECYQAADVYLMLKTYEHLMELIGRPRYGNTQPSITFTSDTILVDGQVISAANNHRSVDDNRLDQLNDLGIGIGYLRREVVAKDPKDNEPREYIETTTRSIGPMKKLYMQIEFTPAVDRDLLQLWEASNRKDRFAFVGVGAASVLGLLGMVWGLLKVDTATKGYYTKRLFIGVPIAIIGGALVLLSSVF